jgi:hypothetical protein
MAFGRGALLWRLFDLWINNICQKIIFFSKYPRREYMTKTKDKTGVTEWAEKSINMEGFLPQTPFFPVTFFPNPLSEATFMTPDPVKFAATFLAGNTRFVFVKNAPIAFFMDVVYEVATQLQADFLYPYTAIFPSTWPTSIPATIAHEQWEGTQAGYLGQGKAALRSRLLYCFRDSDFCDAYTGQLPPFIGQILAVLDHQAKTCDHYFLIHCENPATSPLCEFLQTGRVPRPPPKYHRKRRHWEK